MCGFSGFIDSKLALSQDAMRALIQKMTRTLIHRGPDDEGYWCDPKKQVALGFRRLAIIETSQIGHQPMVSSDNQCAMVFNGEVYNYIEIKQQLASEGVAIEVNSDSVVLFHALMHWGVEKTLSKLNGMFAIAFWHGHQSKLYLIRDRLGQKPLYYFFDGHKILFASELKAMIQYPGFDRTLNQEALHAYLKYNYVPEPLAIYKNTYKVNPGEFLIYSVDSATIQTHAYWNLKAVCQQKESDLSRELLIEKMHEQLKQSVKLRMRSDVPFGSFLSGGVDSSLITALMQAESSQKIKTFSIGFHEADFNEAEYAKEIATHLGTDHHELYVTYDDAKNVIPKLADIYDEPFADMSQIPTYVLSQFARTQVTMALSGDGGDESFAGYNRYETSALFQYLSHTPALVKKAMSGVIQSVSPMVWSKYLSAITKLLPKQFRYSQIGDKLYKLLPFLNCTAPIEIYQLLISCFKNPNDVLRENSSSQFYECVPALNLIQQMMYQDTKHYLPGDILTKVDRASMAVSLEVRSPFLDYHVVEQAWQLPMMLKMHDSSKKIILKKLLSQYVPTQLFERPKMGFGVPMDSWLRGSLRDWAESLLSQDMLEKTGVFYPDVVHRYWREHLSGQQNWQYPLWTLLMFQEWSQRYL